MENDYNTSSKTFTAPVTGYYHIASGITMNVKDTGEVYYEPNEFKKWYQFWKPSFVKRKVFIVENVSSMEVRLVRKGETVPLTNSENSVYRLK